MAYIRILQGLMSGLVHTVIACDHAFDSFLQVMDKFVRNRRYTSNILSVLYIKIMAEEVHHIIPRVQSSMYIMIALHTWDSIYESTVKEVPSCIKVLNLIHACTSKNCLMQCRLVYYFYSL